MEPDAPEPGPLPPTRPQAPVPAEEGHQPYAGTDAREAERQAVAREVEEFYRHAVPRITAVLIRKGAAPAEAAEAAHTALISAARNWRSITTNPMSWCITTAERYHWARKYSADASYDDIAPDSPLLQDPTADVLQRVVDRLQLQQVADRLPDLTARQREVLDLHLAGLGTPEIAEHLAIAPATVRVHLADLRRALDAPRTATRRSEEDR